MRPAQGRRSTSPAFERRPASFSYQGPVGKHLINIVGARLIRANEIESLVDAPRVIGVDPTSRPYCAVLPLKHAEHPQRSGQER